MRTMLAGAVLACVLGFAVLGFAGASVGATPTSPTNCGSLSVGPGSLITRKGDGAHCMLLAYRHNCRRASYRLSSFGVDTIATRTFAVIRRDGSCGVDVTISFEVVPNKPQPTGNGRCRGLRQAGTAIVAFGCRGSRIASTISLTG